MARIASIVNNRPDVTILSNFGKPPRGVSHYSDCLLEALSEEGGVDVHPVDYEAAYPAFLLPYATEQGKGDERLVHWAKPWTWWFAANISASIFHIQYWTGVTSLYLWFIAWLARRRGKRVITTVHNVSPHETGGLFSLTENLLMRMTDALVVHGENARSLLLSRLPTDRRHDIHVIPHGIPLRTKSASTAPGREPGDQTRSPAQAVIFGNLRGYKGLGVLVDAWQELGDRTGDAILVIAGRTWKGSTLLSRLTARLLGTAAYQDMLRKKLDEASGSNIQFINRFLAEVEIEDLLSNATVAVFPYEKFSSQSGAATRAAGKGIPLIVSEVGELPTLIVDEWQRVPAGDVTSLAQAILHALTQPEQLRDTAQRQFDHVAAKYSWPVVARLHRDLYLEVIGASP